MTSSIRVVLADDQDLFRAGIAAIVDAQPDMQVVGQAADGAEAVLLVDEQSPDIVLMDNRMPHMDGVEATQLIFSPDRVSHRDRIVRVVILTTFNLDERAATAIRHGASGFLLKYVTPEMLCQAIRTVHAGNAVLSPTDLTTLMSATFAEPRVLPDGYHELTDRELEVFGAVARGLSNAEIAEEILSSESTVKTHVGGILRKLGLRDRVQIVVFSHDHGITSTV
ncbi:response regulator [Aeromicrobium wangtongii]|uniref:Response regulator transcription factor n=1 Tax=Aeromicrobium wangtongii TaxID=2969247 RepID=A0ABY5M4Z9_9ACTN|nr:response regulator transcription factor [Aeromicrobium wangtongii]MCD9198000.1 response regulator transcription factor [Aeromicrobium wangtongii]UUP12044.1 response regulator transcription factor [Aeromicrobium wangtongii]